MANDKLGKQAAYQHMSEIHFLMNTDITDLIFENNLQILFNAFPIKDMSALCLNRIFGDLVTDPANSCFSNFFNELIGVCLAAKYQIRMACHLSHTCQQTKDVGVV